MSDDAPRDLPPPPEVTQELFLHWRSPRRGGANPERQDNPVWEWLIRSRESAYSANQQFGGPSPFEAGPGWCYDRLGRSETELPDGRRILIAGEHEDYTDPDFYIYNDVVILHSDGQLEIFGYSEETFPPTDFHSATFVDGRILILGNLGYPAHRRPLETPVFSLDPESLAISPVETEGQPPGWIHKHAATLSDDGRTLLIQGGLLVREEGPSLVENIDDWALDVEDGHWTRLTDRQWPRREIGRADGRSHHLFQIRSALWYRSMGMQDERDEAVAELTAQLGRPVDLDRVDDLYRPPVPHELVEGDDAFDTVRIRVDGVVVRYVESHAIQMTVEGQLPLETVEVLAMDLQEKMAKLEQVPCVVRVI